MDKIDDVESTYVDEENWWREQYRKFIEENGDIVIEIDHTNGKVYFTNNCKKFNITENIVNQSFEELVQDGDVYYEDVPILHKFFVDKQKGGRLVSAELRAKTRNGNFRWVRIASSFFYNQKGEKVHSFYTLEDIQDAKLMNLETNSIINLESNKSMDLEKGLLGQLVLNLTKGCVLKYISDIFGDSHDLAIHNLDHSSIESFFQKVTDITMDENTRERFQKLFNREFLLEGYSNQKKIQFEYKRKKSSGKSIWVQLVVKYIKSPQTGDIFAFIYSYDITKKHNMNKIMRYVVNTHYELLLLVNINTKMIENVLCADEEIDDTFVGHEYDSMVKQNMERLVVPEDKDECIKANSLATVMKALEDSESYSCSFSFLNKNTNLRERKLWKHVMFGEEKDRILITREDVTDIYKNDQEQKDVLKHALLVAREANKAKSDFLSSMSHDIRTPMNAIVGMADLAIADEKDEEQIHESLTVIKNSSKQLLCLLNDILDMSRIESGKMILSSEKFIFSEFFDVLIHRWAPVAGQKQLVFNHDFRVLHDCCIGDVMRLDRVVDNLMGNAIKFTPAGGTIYLELREIDSDKPNIGFYRIFLKDTGIGMCENTLKHIFEPFYRSENSMTSKIEGSGLGLAIVKSIIDLKGGTIDVKSKKGRGTTFVVTIPLHIANETVAFPKSEENDPDKTKQDKTDMSILESKSVLLVEDHPINQMVARKILEKAGLKVCTADNGQAAVEMFTKEKEGSFDIILMDVQMPIMNGYEATMAIRSSNHPQAATIPIIAMTANAFQKDVKKALDIGMTAHLPKPIEPERLYRMMCKYLM